MGMEEIGPASPVHSMLPLLVARKMLFPPKVGVGERRRRMIRVNVKTTPSRRKMEPSTPTGRGSARLTSVGSLSLPRAPEMPRDRDREEAVCLKNCPCGWGLRDPPHLISSCLRYLHHRIDSAITGQHFPLSYSQLFTTSKGAKRLMNYLSTSRAGSRPELGPLPKNAVPPDDVPPEPDYTARRWNCPEVGLGRVAGGCSSYNLR
ncbi:hypothetical protein EDB85DRAFT_2281880 [Lactarius pseudohatsudake]|nr:hypothetical protein EDB85DRAFT_2281880 [Lactarius pseudohatsudake]